MTLFEKIAAGQIPAKIIFETDDLFAFEDINPQAPVHVLIVPKRVVTRLGDSSPDDSELLGTMLVTSRSVAEQLGVRESGYRIVINSGRDAGETIPHLHMHLLAGRAMGWPPG
jgi:histidine triad (HIT) family protein